MDIVQSSAKKAQAHQRYYVEICGKKKQVPGVTTITGVMDKPALVKWANDLGLNGINVKDYVDDLKDAGTCAHRMVELDCQGIKDPTRHPDMRAFTGDQINLAMTSYVKYLEWKDEVGFIPSDSELQLTHDNLMYGGTIDILGKLTKCNDQKMLVDIKTSKGVFGEHKTQVYGGYSMLLDANLYEYDGIIILRLGRNEDEGFEVITATPTEISNHQERFKICRQLYEINKVCNRW